MNSLKKSVAIDPLLGMPRVPTLHTFLVCNLRLGAGRAAQLGQAAREHVKAALGRMLDALGERGPALVRGDSGDGNAGVLLTLEQRKQPYLLRDCGRPRTCSAWWPSSAPETIGVGLTTTAATWWQGGGVEAHLQRQGWSAKRRVDGNQLKLELALPSVHEGDKLWEYAVPVTDVTTLLEAIGQSYRDRADAENAIDELENPRGLGGFTTQDINPSTHQLLPNRGSGLRSGLQLVELVLPGSEPRGSNGGHHQSPAAAGRSG